MLKGFNSDITVRGQRYHVQTEDWGGDNPFLVTRVFRDGAVIKTVKVAHREAAHRAGGSTTEVLRSALKQQHTEILDALLSGSLF